MANAVYVDIPNRAMIHVAGADAFKFLQGLITNDMRLLETQDMIYACLLTPQGKFLYDFFIRKDGAGFIIDCEGGARAESLLKKLTQYKIRANVTLALQDNVPVYQIFIGSDFNATIDPRNTACGYRSYTQPEDIESVAYPVWDEHRIRNEIPDGSRDLIVDKSYIHEGRLDDLNAVSYTKGCYVGQELVSRMHHRGLTKKILKCVDLDGLSEGAELRSTCGNVGLAVVKL